MMKQGKVAEKRVHIGWDNRKRKKSKLQEEEKSERRSEVKERKRRYVKDETRLGENEMKRKMRKKSRNRCWCYGDDGCDYDEDTKEQRQGGVTRRRIW